MNIYSDDFVDTYLNQIKEYKNFKQKPKSTINEYIEFCTQIIKTNQYPHITETIWDISGVHIGIDKDSDKPMPLKPFKNS